MVAVADEQMLTTKEVAARLRVTQWTVLQWLRTGKLQGYRLGGTRAGWRIPEAELQRFLSTRWRAGTSDSEVVEE